MKGALSPKKEMAGGRGIFTCGTGAVFVSSLAADDDEPDPLQQVTEMPGFDPVRDAVLNSPITRSPTMPRHQPPLSASPPTSVNNAPAPIAQAPRRATVAALLNDTPSSPSSSFHPPHLPVRASSLAHILHPNPPDDPPRFPSPEDKLSRVSSLSRHPGASTSLDVIKVSSLSSGISHHTAGLGSPPQPDSLFSPTTERVGLFTPTVEQRGPMFPIATPASPTSVRSTLSRPSTSSSTSHRPPPSPVMIPRPPPRARSPTPPRQPSPPPKPKPLPYNPRRRTPAGSVLEPLTQAEAQFYTRLGTGTQRLAKRKRSPSFEPPASQPPQKRSRDTGLVMDHCTYKPSLP